MLRKILVVLLVCACSLILASASMAQDEAAESQEAVAQSTVKGVISEIAADSSNIVVNGTKILTTPEFMEDSYLEVGDKVEVTVEKTSQGLSAVDYDYLYDDEEDMGAMEDMTEDVMEDTENAAEDIE